MPLPFFSIFGPGRLGRTLHHLLTARGAQVELVGRGQIPTASIILLTVPDAIIPEVCATLPSGALVLHTAGALDVEILRPHTPAGSWHPLMTFPGPELAVPNLTNVGAAVAGDPPAIAFGRLLSEELGMFSFEFKGDRRLYHAAAVIAGNFMTVLLAEASTVLATAGVDPTLAHRLLLPLAQASLANASVDPARSLTGPAARGDLSTIRAHQTALSNAGLNSLRTLYDELTASAFRLTTQRPIPKI